MIGLYWIGSFSMMSYNDWTVLDWFIQSDFLQRLDCIGLVHSV